jgi:predicted ester cyclase
VPPTGRQVTIIGNDFSRVGDDKIAEHWAQFDGLGTMMQLGAIAAPEPEDVSAHMRLS